ncbi:MAG: hypothetical protein JNJ45_11630 [Chthonomonas sp.]|nr:hypothetical protein [Chthonomonas sp.]
MNEQKDKLKLGALIAVIVVAIAFAIGYAAKTASADKEQVVGTLDMGAGGGRNAEGGAPAGDPGNGPPETR